jgi:hypothetical protein
MESSRQPTVNSRQISLYNAFSHELKAEFKKEIPLLPVSGKEGDVFSGSMSVV